MMAYLFLHNISVFFSASNPPQYHNLLEDSRIFYCKMHSFPSKGAENWCATMLCCLSVSLLPHTINSTLLITGKLPPAATASKFMLIKLCKSLLELMSVFITKYFVSSIDSVFKSCLSHGNIESGRKTNISTTYLKLKLTNWKLALSGTTQKTSKAAVGRQHDVWQNTP